MLKERRIEFPKTATERLVVMPTEYAAKIRGEPSVDVRIWWRPDAHRPDEWHATKKGVTIPMSIAESVAQAIADVYDDLAKEERLRKKMEAAEEG